MYLRGRSVEQALSSVGRVEELVDVPASDGGASRTPDLVVLVAVDVVHLVDLGRTSVSRDRFDVGEDLTRVAYLSSFITFLVSP